MIHFLFLFLTVSTLSVPAQQSQVARELDLDLRQGIEAVMHHRFEHADSLFEVMSLTYADHPVGPVMKAAVIHLRAEDRIEDVDMGAIDSLQALAEERGGSYSLDDPEGRQALAFLSSGRGIVSIEASRQGSWFKALQYALDGSSLGEDILEMDSSVADAGLTVGNYYYWKSRRVEALTWLPFVVDSREEGIALLRHCATKGTYQRYAAMNSLGWILRDADSLTEAAEWIAKGLTDYPMNRPFLRNSAEVLERAESYSEAREAWLDVLRSLEKDGALGSWSEYECRVALARLAAKEGSWDLLRQDVDAVNDVERTLDRTLLTKRRESLLQRAADLKEQLSARSNADPSPNH